MLASSADGGPAKLAGAAEFGHKGNLTRGISFQGAKAEIDRQVENLFPAGGTFSDLSFMSTLY